MHTGKLKNVHDCYEEDLCIAENRHSAGYLSP